MTATLSPAEAGAYRTELARLRRLRELETQRIERAWAGTPPFWCTLPDCDGHEHDGFPYRHARTVQRPPPGDWFAWWLRGGRGAGKLLHVETPIPTPTGWTTIGALQVGDRVFDEQGWPCSVTWVSETRHEDSYRLTFSDGSDLLACGEHQWITWTHAERKAFLRSPYENTRRFPADWPTWQLRRAVNPPARSLIEQALTMIEQGLSVRETARQLGVNRSTFTPHLRANGYIEPDPNVWPAPLGPQIRTTAEIAATLRYSQRGDLNHCIPNAGPLDLPNIDLPIEPYVLGAWLGDGHSAGAAITTADPEVLDGIRIAGYEIGKPWRHQNAGRAITRGIGHGPGRGRNPARDPTTGRIIGDSSLNSALRALGLLRNKHVPAAYLRASARQRLALLTGLMDTDGGVERGSRVSFTTTKEPLADAVYELVVSLGMRAYRDKRPAKLNGVEHGTAYRVTFTPTVQVFTIPRKADQLTFDGPQALRRHHRMIVAVDPIPTVPMRCIAVDSPNRMYLAGRAMIPTHNTRAGAEWFKEQARAHPGSRGALVGPTQEDVRLTMVEGDSGVLSVLPPSVLRGGSVEDSWNRGPCELYLANGTRWKGFSSERPGRLRGPQHHYAWGDEPAEWDDAGTDPLTTTKGTTMSNLEFGLRLGHDPRLLLTGTPKTVLLVRRLLWKDGDPEKGPAPGVVIVRSSTYDNLDNLAAPFKAKILDSYEGTTLGLQELHAEYLEENPGALWKREQLQRDRVSEAPALSRIAVGVDPSGGAGEVGIVVVGKAGQRDGYILDDRSGHYTPEGWGRQAVLAWHDWQANVIVVETNFGGDMAKSTIQVAAANLLEEGAITAMPMVKVTHSSRGKAIRAEPVAAASEQGRIHLVGIHARLEDQLVGWVPGESDYSPDRLDAMIFSCTELGLGAFSGQARFGGLRAAETRIG